MTMVGDWCSSQTMLIIIGALLIIAVAIPKTNLYQLANRFKKNKESQQVKE